MCKKQIPHSKSNQNFLIYPLFLVFITFMVTISGCTDDYEYLGKSDSVKNFYPEIAEHITERNFSGLLEFTGHEDVNVSKLAWRAISHTDISDEEMDELLRKVTDSDVKGGWFALSLHELNETLLHEVREGFRIGEFSSPDVCEVFFRQGGVADLELLLSYDDIKLVPICSKAIGGILSRTQVPDNLNREIVQMAFETDNAEVRRNLLYGYFRSSSNRPEGGSDFYTELIQNWQNFGFGKDEFVDITMVRLLGVEGFQLVMDSLNHRELNKMPGLSTELAVTLNRMSPNRSNMGVIFRLLHHDNPHVVVQALTSLTQLNRVSVDVLDRIKQEILAPTRNAEVFATALNLFIKNGKDVSVYRTLLDYYAERNPYLTDRFLVIYSALDSDREYFDRLRSHIENGEIEALHAGRMLTAFLQRDGILNDFRTQADQLIQTELVRGDRSILDGLTGLFLDDDILANSNINLLTEAYSRYVEEGSLESAQIIGRVLEERIPDRFTPSDEIERQEFYTPDFEKLYQMGIRPFWTLETEKGTIQIRLNPLTAPFTVSSIYNLTQNGSYDGAVFHRVVRNFVAQGGDFDRRDGFGGPEYRIPTEPSFDTFERGKAGIASSGIDTEGSQFFFMHQWSPHLDGLYTNFGTITRGMDVLDKLQVGDKIIEASIYPDLD